MAFDHDMERYLAAISHLRDEFFRKLLEEMIRVFQPLVPADAGLWAAIRIIQADGEHGCNSYHTLLRAGAVDHGRSGRTHPVREDRGLPRYLRQQYEIGRGIVILDENRAPDVWEASPNDMRKEDASFMAGPIFMKSSMPPEMTMILSLNSPKTGVFLQDHTPFMKCCTDVLSLFLSTVGQIAPAVRQRHGTHLARRPS